MNEWMDFSMFEDAGDPPEELWAFRTILMQIDTQLKRFTSAVSLYEHTRKINADAHAEVDRHVRELTPTEGGRTPRGRSTLAARKQNLDELRRLSDDHDWWPLAAREGALALWGMREAMGFTKKQLKRAPALRKAVNEATLNAATEEFDEKWPDAELFRHAVAHEVEAFASIARYRAEAVDGPIDASGLMKSEGGQILTGLSLADRTVYIGKKRRLLSYDLSPDTVTFIRKLRDQFVGAIAEVAKNDTMREMERFSREHRQDQ